MDWIEDKKEEFVNPYNFVSFAGESPKRDNMENQDKETLSGVIECTLKTITPIFIPDTNNVKSDGGHKSYIFFSYKDNKPVIPASEIRGMIRSAFEAVTNSCMSSVDDTYPVSRTTKPKTPGLLKWDDKLKKWCLYKAKRYMLRTKKDKGSDSENKNYVIKYNEYNNNEPYIQINGEKYSNGKKINFEEGKAYKKNGYEIGKTVKLIGKGDKTGYLYLGEDSKGKHHDSIFELIEEEYIDIKEDDVKRFKRVLEIYVKDSKTDNTGYKSYKLSEKETDYNPCWYEKVENNIYISPACISKNAYKNTLYKLLGEYKPCTSKNEICEACSLFGTVNGKLVVPSRLRFTDANLKTNNSDCFDEDITLQELASPKNTATEFYTVQPDGAKFWNYDFEVVDYRDKQPEYKLIDNLKLRGRKFYWHSDAFDWYRDNMSKTAEKNKRNITIQPLKKDLEFTFNIYYDKLTKEELKELIWVLNIGENDGYTKCHKIGTGKPLGLGSVKITVNEIKKRKICLNNNTIKYNNGDDEPEDLDKYINYYNTDINIKNKININSDPVKEFLKITDINSTKGLTVSYPLADSGKGDENSKASHQWFNANRGNPMKPEINRSLPKILDKVLTLSKFKKVDKTNNNNKNKPQKKNTKEKQYNYTPKESSQETRFQQDLQKLKEVLEKK